MQLAPSGGRAGCCDAQDSCLPRAPPPPQPPRDLRTLVLSLEALPLLSSTSASCSPTSAHPGPGSEGR